MSDELTPEELQILSSLQPREQLSYANDRFNARTARLQAETEAERPVVQSVLAFADLSVKSLLILNGGAVIALLAFAGQAMGTRIPAESITAYSSAVYWFGLAAALAVLIAGLAYLAQLLFRDQALLRYAQGCLIGALALWSISWLMFVFGVFAAADAIRLSPRPPEPERMRPAFVEPLPPAPVEAPLPQAPQQGPIPKAKR